MRPLSLKISFQVNSPSVSKGIRNVVAENDYTLHVNVFLLIGLRYDTVYV